MILEEHEFYVELGDRIKNQRLKLKISQDALATDLGLTRTSIVNFERGRHRPSIYQLIRLGELLRIDFNEFVPYSFEKEQNSVKVIDLNNVVVSDREDLKVEEKRALASFLTKISKE